MTILPVYPNSLFASKKRPDGIGLDILYDNGVVYTNMLVDERFEGYRGVVHGGIVFSILDVLMWYTILLGTRRVCMTRKTEMEFLKPVLCNTMYRAEGKLVKVEDKDVFVSAWVQDDQGERYAEVNGLFRDARGPDIAAVIDSLDFSLTSPEMKAFFHSLIPENGV